MTTGWSGSAAFTPIEPEKAQPSEPASAQGGLITTNRVLGYGGVGLGVAGVGLVGASLAVGF